MQKQFVSVLTLSSLLFCPACWITKQQGEQIQADITSITRQNQQLKQSQEIFVARTTQRIKELAAQTDSLAKRLDYLDQSAHRGTADVGMEVSSLKQELAALRGEIEVNANNLLQMGQRMDKVEIDVQNPIIQAPPPPPPPPLFADENKVTAETSKEVKNETVKETTGENKTAAKDDKDGKKDNKVASKDKKKETTANDKLEEADKLLQAKKYQQAMVLYNTVASNTKNGIKVGIHDKAIFGTAECMAGMGNYTGAMDRYQEVFVTVKKTPLKELAFYKIAVSAEKNGERGLAADTYQLFLNEFPNSTYAPAAKKAIEKLQSKKKKK